jgi:hypothetical protein
VDIAPASQADESDEGRGGGSEFNFCTWTLIGGQIGVRDPMGELMSEVQQGRL